ncbi:MAG TPA: DUF4870 domain-containing protein [Allocoleopsis sp.]
MYDPDKRKILSLACHSSIFFSIALVSVGVPAAILFISDDPVVKGNAKEALNFHFTMWIYGGLIAVLAFSIIGIPLAWILGCIAFLLNYISPVLAILKALGNSDESYRYPLIIHLL